MITIRDIARKSGFSKSTVALALSDSDRCALSTKGEVKRVAAAMGYRRDPSLVARMAYVGTRTRRGAAGPSLAYLTDFDRRTIMSTDRPGQNGYLAAKARAEELGCTMDLLSYGGPEVSMRRLHRIIASRGILGLVIAPHSTPQIELDLNWSEFSIVCAGFSIKSPRFDRVGFDHYEAMVDVCEGSWQRGYRRLALVMTSDNDARVMHLARAAFLRWESDHIHDREPPVLVMARDQPEVVRSWYERLKPDCILLYGRVKWLLEAGIPVGREVAVVTPLMSEHQRELGGYNIQLGNITTTSVDMLLAKISRNERGLPAMRQTLLIQAPWVEGLAAFAPAPKGRSPTEVSGQSEGRRGKAS